MENEFLYGCAYYPEYMPYERIDEDFALMQKAGMNVVRIAESTWSTLEPKEGEYDFYHIDEVLKKSREVRSQGNNWHSYICSTILACKA